MGSRQTCYGAAFLPRTRGGDLAVTTRVSLVEALAYAEGAYNAGAWADAESICRQIVAANRDYFDAVHLLALTCAAQGRGGEAVELYDQALSLNPDHVQALSNRSAALHGLGRYDEAIADCDRALALRAGHFESLNNRGAALRALGRPAEALASFDRALFLHPDFADALFNRGNVLQELARPGEAVASYDRALAVRGVFPQALTNRGNALRALNRFDEAVADYDKALAMQPGLADARFNRAVTLHELKHYEQALADFDTTLKIQPDHPYALNGVAECVMRLCDWKRRDEVAARLKAEAAAGPAVVFPYPLAAYSDDASLLRQAAERYFTLGMPNLPAQLERKPAANRRTIRIAYLSADFREHATSYLMRQLFALHDRDRFEVIGISYGPDDHSAARARIIGAFDAFHDVKDMSDENAAILVRDLEVDIAIDLKGYTKGARPRILSWRPAAVQVSYMGFAATMAAPFIDYIIADPVVLPLAEQPHFSEKIVHLPDTYWVTDTSIEVAPRTPTRAEAGLPDQGFVFCSFNAGWKITPAVFDVWMRLLGQVTASVLWLFAENETARENLRVEARARDIDPDRLVFAAPLPLDQHLARHALADLFLDTLPYNAHTTASDALWSGLPVVTCKGKSFVGRVAASQLEAAGLPDLIAAGLADYEALALALAREPGRLNALRERLRRNRELCPLFDTARFARGLEAAYEAMTVRQKNGLAPASLVIPPLQPGDGARTVSAPGASLR